jgi:hypothetical protein
MVLKFARGQQNTTTLETNLYPQKYALSINQTKCGHAENHDENKRVN